MLLKDVIHTCGGKDLEMNLYYGSYDPTNEINFESARYEELAFQEVLQIIPLMGNSNNPEPGLALVIKDGDPVIPEVMIPNVGSLKEYLATLPEEVHAIIDGEFTGKSLVQQFYIERNYPEIPVIRFEVADTVTMVVIPQ